MKNFRKITFILSALAFFVCSVALNGMGGIAILTMSAEKYRSVGIMLLISTLCFLAAFIFLIFKKTITDIISLVFSAAGTVLYALPISSLNAISEELIPKDSIQVLTGRIYPSIIVSVLFGLTALLGIFSPENIEKREKRRAEREAEKNRELTESERII